MAEDNKAIVRRWFEQVWNRGRIELIDELRAPAAVAHGLDEQRIQGNEAFKQFYMMCRERIRDLRVDVADIIAEDDRVAVRVVLSGTHRDQPIRAEGAGFIRVENGKLTEGWNVWDATAIAAQLGIGERATLASVIGAMR